MANNENINKVIYGTSTLIDLTEDTVSADRMYKGDIAHAADGSEIIGTAEVTVEDTCLIMPEGLVTPIGTVDPDTYEWIRPDYLPDLDSIYNDETNTIYMTIDATGRIPDPHLNIYFTASGGYTVEIGSIQNGIFVVDETINKASSNYFTKVWEPTPGLYPVVKLSASKNVTSFKFNTWTSDNDRIYHAQYQPMTVLLLVLQTAYPKMISLFFLLQSLQTTARGSFAGRPAFVRKSRFLSMRGPHNRFFAFDTRHDGRQCLRRLYGSFHADEL